MNQDYLDRLKRNQERINLAERLYSNTEKLKNLNGSELSIVNRFGNAYPRILDKEHFDECESILEKETDPAFKKMFDLYKSSRDNINYNFAEAQKDFLIRFLKRQVTEPEYDAVLDNSHPAVKWADMANKAGENVALVLMDSFSGGFL